jgi:hypothetical protein
MFPETITVPVALGKVAVFVPATAGTARLIDPDVSPAILIDDIVYP